MQQPKILVAIRKRPLSKKQTSKGQTDIISVKNSDTVIVSEYKQKVDLTKFLEETIFNFDFAFNEQTQNEEIYDCAVRPLVDSAFQGAKVTCFAYGQTGSGKTYTMNGNMGQGVPGLYALAACDIFEYLASPQFRHLKAKLSFYEIYCGKLFDLLNKRNELKLRQDNKSNINIIGLEQAHVTSTEEFYEYLAMGSQQRVTSANSANADSSRSHAILQITLKEGKKLYGKISFIDLAGNERGADHMDMNKQTRIDGAEINKSLLSLKECIRALDQGKGHTPFRGSKLTMVLKDSFVGFCRTFMIGNVSPSSASSQNTLNTLRYADRVKELRKPTEGVSKEDLKAKELMLPRQNKNAIKIMIDNDDDADDIARKRGQAQKQYGIVEEVTAKKSPQRDENSTRKNSYGPKVHNSIKNQLSKSSSVNKNYPSNSLGNKQPLTNNLVGPNPSLRNNPSRKVPQTKHEPQPPPFNRYNSSNQGLGMKREEPMEVQPPSAPYYVPSNSNKNIGNSGNKAYGGMGYNRQLGSNYSSVVTPSQNVSSNFSQISNANRTSNEPYAYNQFNKNIQPMPQNPIQQGNSFLARGHQPIQPQNVVQPPFKMPEKWGDLVSTVTNISDPQVTESVVGEMNRQLFRQQQELMQSHSETLRHEIDIIKSQMGLLNQMEIERGRITGRGYVRFMQQSIEQKMSQLQMLRERLVDFTYKLDEMQEIQNGLGGQGSAIDDQQLLDDINL